MLSASTLENYNKTANEYKELLKIKTICIKTYYATNIDKDYKKLQKNQHRSQISFIDFKGLQKAAKESVVLLDLNCRRLQTLTKSFKKL